MANSSVRSRIAVRQLVHHVSLTLPTGRAGLKQKQAISIFCEMYNIPKPPSKKELKVWLEYLYNTEFNGVIGKKRPNRLRSYRSGDSDNTGDPFIQLGDQCDISIV